MRHDVLGVEAFSPVFSRQIMSAWERFLVTGSCGRDQVRDVIRSSWERCRTRQVPPTVAEAPLVAAGDNLWRLQEDHRDLLDVTREIVGPLSGVLNQSRSVLVVTDPQGVILNAYGDPATMESGAERHIVPGGLWEEHTSGTNAIGTAIASGSAVQVHALEHYCESVKGWTCSAALVRDAGGNDILGAIDISGFDNTFNTHSLALALSIATQIESVLKGREARDRVRLLEWCSAETTTRSNDNFVLLDSKGRIVSASRNASEALRRIGVPQSLAPGQPLVGAPRGAVRQTTRLAPWIRPEWVQHVRIDGKNFGSLIVIPDRTSPASDKAGTSAMPSTARPARGFDKLVGMSEAIKAAIDRARRLAGGTLPVLMLGETGVGKEEFARAIHETSPVDKGPFIAVNCGAFARELVASELFGYADGAFTGAVKGGRRGKFEEADGGTLFLDEIGELPLDVQPHLLRVLEDGFVTRIGESRNRKVKVRIISATNRDLSTLVAQGRFREDLYYRFAVATLSLPPLRSRQCDIILLAEHFVEEFARRTGTPIKTISAQVREALYRHTWRGNIRELRNTLESMCQLSEDDTLQLAGLPTEFGLSKSEHRPIQFVGLKAREREAIIAAIDEHGGNLRQAARALGIARSTLYEKMRLYGIRRSFLADGTTTDSTP